MGQAHLRVHQPATKLDNDQKKEVIKKLKLDIDQMAKKGREIQFEADHVKAALDESLEENKKVRNLISYIYI